MKCGSQNRADGEAQHGGKEWFTTRCCVSASQVAELDSRESRKEKN